MSVFAIIGTFLKNKIFSVTGVLITAMVLLIGSLVWSNSDTILSKFGFETKTNLKGSLVKAQEDLKTAVDSNKRLNDELKEKERYNQQLLKELEYLENDKIAMSKEIEEIKKGRSTKVAPKVNQFKKDTVMTDKTVTVPVDLLDEISADNLQSVQEAYDRLFSGAPVTEPEKDKKLEAPQASKLLVLDLQESGLFEDSPSMDDSQTLNLNNVSFVNRSVDHA